MCWTQTYCRWWQWCPPAGGHKVSPNMPAVEGNGSMQLLCLLLLMRNLTSLLSETVTWTFTVVWCCSKLKSFARVLTVFSCFVVLDSQDHWGTRSSCQMLSETYSVYICSTVGLKHIAAKLVKMKMGFYNLPGAAEAAAGGALVFISE